MEKHGGWLIRYLLVIAVALILGAAIGELDLFQKTALGSAKLKLTAANLVRFTGYGSALVLLWLLGQRAAFELKSQSDWKRSLGFFVLPLTTLIIVPAAHRTLLLVFGGLLGPELGKIYDWLFILGTMAAAIWFVVALFQHLETLIEAMRGSPGVAPG